MKNEAPNFKENISTILVIYCQRFSLNNTIDIDEIIYGNIHQGWELSKELVPQVKFEIKDKILNANSYTSTSLIAIWDGKEKFFIHNKLYTNIKNNIPLFLTKKDINYFLKDELFSISSGMRIKILEKYQYNKLKLDLFKINDIFTSSDNFIEILNKEIEETYKILNEQRRIIFKG